LFWLFALFFSDLLPRLLKDTAPRSLEELSGLRTGARRLFLGLRRGKSLTLFYQSIGVLLVILFLARFESGADYLMGGQPTDQRLSFTWGAVALASHARSAIGAPRSSSSSSLSS
jgi:hypothetical protein